MFIDLHHQKRFSSVGVQCSLNISPLRGLGVMHGR